MNGDGDAFDSFLRVFRRETEITAGQTLVADAAPLIDGRPVAIIGDHVLFRSPESGNARRKIVRISESVSGGAARGSSSAPSLSRDGRWIAFESTADDLGAEPSDGSRHAFLADVDTGTVQRIRLDYEDRVDPDAPARSPQISGNARFATLSAPDSEGLSQVWVYDRDADGNGVLDEVGGTSTAIASVSPRTLENFGNGPSSFPTINRDGRIVAFHSQSSNVRI
jgi:hypothetical protein